MLFPFLKWNVPNILKEWPREIFLFCSFQIQISLKRYLDECGPQAKDVKILAFIESARALIDLKEICRSQTRDRLSAIIVIVFILVFLLIYLTSVLLLFSLLPKISAQILE